MIRPMVGMSLISRICCLLYKINNKTVWVNHKNCLLTHNVQGFTKQGGPDLPKVPPNTKTLAICFFPQ